MPRQTSGGGNRMTRLLDTIGGRVIALLLLLASVAMTGPVTTYVAAQRHDAALAELERIAESRPLIERLRAGIYQVVMESRGLYLAADRKQAETFARGQMAALGDIRATFDKLRQAVPDQHRDALAKAEAPLRAFIALRTELARVGVEQGREAADKLGNNAENRSTRTAFSNSRDGLANEVAATVDGLRTALADTGRNVAQQMLVFTLAAVLLVLMLALWMVRTTIGGPVRRVVGGITAMARGELDATDLPARARGEIGAIVAAAHQLRQALTAARAADALLAITSKATEQRQRATDRHTLDFGGSISGVLTALADSATVMQGSEREMAKVAQDSHFQADHSAAEVAASMADLTAVTAATEQLSASAREIGSRVADAADATQTAVGHADIAGARMASLLEAADRIVTVVDLITSIAGRTNLLALNATIEAARAGEAGRGFAVVAGEVKLLATQTGSATAQIAAQVEGIRGVIREAADAASAVLGSIRRVETVASSIAAAIDEQGRATSEIAARVSDVASKSHQISQSMAQLTQDSTQGSTISADVETSANTVSTVAATLGAEVDQFLIAMQNTKGERRVFDRLPGHGFAIRLAAGGVTHDATVVDVSLGSIALRIARSPLKAGADVTVLVPGTHLALLGRVARLDGDITSVAFRQNPETLVLAEAFIAMVGATTGQARAA